MRPRELEEPIAEPAPPVPAKTTLKAYVSPTPKPFHDGEVDVESDWPAEILALSDGEVKSLAPLDLKCDYKTVRGGRAKTTNRQKTAVIRAVWRRASVADAIATLPAQVHQAYAWLIRVFTTTRTIHDKLMIMVVFRGF